LPPLQSGVGNVTNAVLARFDSGPFRPLTAYTEVVQDAMLQLLRSGTMTMASTTAFFLTEDGIAELRENIETYRDRIILRPQEISNNPEVIRRLGCLAMNGMIEADIYGNKNGAISCIVPMVSHVDHTEHDVHVIVTEQGVGDLRGLPPQRCACRGMG
jgi:succinyl-CoA:acetate CoA-transferase